MVESIESKKLASSPLDLKINTLQGHNGIENDRDSSNKSSGRNRVVRRVNKKSLLSSRLKV